MPESRSWFYLTLWRGTPPEFTEEFTVDITESDSAFANIITADSVGASVKKESLFDAKIDENFASVTNIVTKTEVTWYVG